MNFYTRVGKKMSLEKIGSLYKKIFSIEELEKDIVVKWFFGYCIFTFAIVFKTWMMHPHTATNAYSRYGPICWPFFQGCEDFIFMTTLPDGYTQQYFYMAMMGVMALAIFFAVHGRWAFAHFCVLVLFMWKMYVTSIHFWFNANYDYYHTSFVFIFLFLPHKRFFWMLTLASFYFLSTATKIHETWILGTYFSALKTGLPIFPDTTIPVWTNLVVIMEMVFVWFLFSKNWIMQRGVFLFFCAFHLYSGILVGYHYPLIVFSALLILFGYFYKPQVPPVDWKSIPGWSFMLTLLCLQMISHMIPGDEKLTMEGNFYGLYMFEANYQCTVRVYDMDNGETLQRISSTNARNRCSPYWYMKRTQFLYCRNNFNTKQYGFSMEISINGGPFKRVVKEKDLCALEYKPLQKNDWIKTEDEAEPVARPLKNFYK